MVGLSPDRFTSLPALAESWPALVMPVSVRLSAASRWITAASPGPLNVVAPMSLAIEGIF
jgi:hypothetical protein